MAAKVSIQNHHQQQQPSSNRNKEPRDEIGTANSTIEQQRKKKINEIKERNERKKAK